MFVPVADPGRRIEDLGFAEPGVGLGDDQLARATIERPARLQLEVGDVPVSEPGSHVEYLALGELRHRFGQPVSVSAHYS